MTATTDETGVVTYTEDEFEDFCEVLWSMTDKPTKPNWKPYIPEEYDTDRLAEVMAIINDEGSRIGRNKYTDEEYDVLSKARYKAVKAEDRIPDEEEAEKQAMVIFKRARTRDTTILLLTRSTAGMKFYAKGEDAEKFGKLPEFDTVWDVTVAKETDKSFGIKRALARKDWREDRYFQSPFEAGPDDSLLWIPKSGATAIRIITAEAANSLLVGPEGVRRGKSSEADVRFTRMDTFGRFPRIYMESPYAAKDAISPNSETGLARDTFHPKWNGEEWHIDATTVRAATEHLVEQGFTVSVPVGLERWLKQEGERTFLDMEGYVEA